MIILPTSLSLDYVFELDRPLKSKVQKQPLKQPIQSEEAAQIKQMLNMIVSDSEQYYDQNFVRIFCLIKINSLLSNQCNINNEFVTEFIRVYNSKKVISVRLSKSDDQFFSQVMLETEIYKFIEIQNVHNILPGQCLLATSLALMIKQTQLFLKKAQITFTLSFLALSGRNQAFIPNVHQDKNHYGQIKFAEAIDEYIKIDNPEKHRRIQLEFRRVQDPYSMRCSPQVYGVVYDCLQYLKENFDSIINKFHFKTLYIDGQSLPNVDLFAQNQILKGDFIVCSLNEIGSMAFLRSQRILNIYLGKNQVHKQNPKQVFQLKALLQKNIHLLADNKLICSPSNGDTMNIHNYQKDIFYTSCKVYEKYQTMMKNLYKVMLLQIFSSQLGLNNIYNIAQGQIFQNQTIRKAFFELQQNCTVKDKKHALYYITNEWLKVEN